MDTILISPAGKARVSGLNPASQETKLPNEFGGGENLMLRMLVGLAVAALLAVSAHAQQRAASSRLDDIIKRGTLRVGMTGDYRPFTFLDKTTQKFGGFDVDM